MQSTKKYDSTRRPAFTRWLIPATVISVCMIITALAISMELSRIKSNDQNHFERLAERLETELIRRTKLFGYGLRSLRAGFNVNTHINSDEFHILYESINLSKDFPAALKIGYIENVTRSDSKHAPTQVVPKETTKNPSRSDLISKNRYIIKYLEPHEEESEDLGLDIGQEPLRRVAAELAAETGEPTISSPVNLINEQRGSGLGFLLFLPVYRQEYHQISPKERINAVIGWLYMPIQAKSLFDNVGQIVEEELDFVIWENSPLGFQNVIFDHDGHRAMGLDDLKDSDHPFSLELHKEIEIGGRTWQLSITDSPEFRREPLINVWGLGITGLLLTLLVGGTVYRREHSLQTAKVSARRNSANLSVYNNILDQHALLSRTNSQGIIVHVNDSFCTLSGYSREELVGNTHRLIDSGEHPREFWETMWKTILQGGYWHGEVCNKAKNGEHYWVSSTIAPLVDEFGAITGFMSVGSDVTAIRKSEKELLASELKFRTLVERTEGIIWEYNSDNATYSYVSPQSLGLGYANEEWYEPNFWTRIIYPDDRENATTQRSMVATTRTTLRHQYRVLTKNGSIVWIDESVNPASSEPNETGQLRGVMIDITEQKLAEELLRVERRRLANVIEGTGAGTWEWNITTGECRFNSRWAEIIGYTLEELSPTNIETWMRFCHPDDLIGSNAAIQACFAGTSTQYEAVCRLKHKNGSWIWVLDRGRIISRDGEGKPLWMAGTHIDITTRKEEEAHLAHALSLAHEATRAKSEFLANMSHEIRTPLNAVIGINNLLLETELSTEQVDLVQTSLESGTALLTMVGDILDFSKLETSRLSLELAPTAIRKSIQDFEDKFQRQILEKNIRFTSLIADDIPQTVLLDPSRLRQVIFNLVGNTLKFTPEGGVVILQISLTKKSCAGGTLLFCVSDTGIGVPLEKQAKIFEAFSQADSSSTRLFGGTGLGLSIAGSLIKLMGGELHLKSTVGVGSCFYFEIPFTHVPAPAAKVKPNISVLNKAADRPLTILLVEDNLVNQKLATKLLEREGHKVDVAGDGQQALLMHSAQTYDVILMDLQMPIMGGEDATRGIRAKETSSHVPIIAVTANATTEDRERCNAAGMDDFVTKPIKKEELLAAIDKVTIKASL